jgi:hypothetical protein
VRHDLTVTSLDFELHKLGWRAFQDLCAIILQAELGQTFHAFADSNDGGRDGAFSGNWTVSVGSGGALAPLAMAGTATVAQCKFSAAASGTLVPSMLTDEISKIEKLHASGRCDAYIVLTNLAVSGRTEEWIADRAASVGVANTLVLDGRWISQQIAMSPDLRRLVPRVYGLGDLGKILDDRRLRQANLLLSRLRDDLGTFVPTNAYRKGADALANHRFVLLLGEPAAGKSTIAAMLSMVALDSWRCSVRRVDSPEELIAAWDPDDPDQLFWVDDAFGAIRHDPQLSDGWVRRMDQVQTALRMGARLILTSRDYVYRDARPFLKDYAYPILRERQVVVDVAELSQLERRRILYNHLKAGDQPAEVLGRWRPHLSAVASAEKFQPELARRLASTAFTASSRLATREQLLDFVNRPIAFLADVLGQLPAGSRAALACVYMAGEELPSPMSLTQAESAAIARLGSSDADAFAAFPSLDGTFLVSAEDGNGDPVWRFRHPTIREGFAALVAQDPNAVRILLEGLTEEELLRQVDCGGEASDGTLVRVPPSLYYLVVPRVRVSPAKGRDRWSDPRFWFLQTRASSAFLREWALYHAGDLPELLSFSSYISAYPEPKVLASLHQAGALPEEIRIQAVAKLESLAMEFDGGWLDERIAGLFTADERQRLLDRVRSEILPTIRDEIFYSADGFDSDVPPEDRFDMARVAVGAYQKAFADDDAVVAALLDAERYIDDQVEAAEEDFEGTDRGSLAPAPEIWPDAARRGTRDEFDDVAGGR